MLEVTPLRLQLVELLRRPAERVESACNDTTTAFSGYQCDIQVAFAKAMLFLHNCVIALLKCPHGLQQHNHKQQWRAAQL